MKVVVYLATLVLFVNHSLIGIEKREIPVLLTTSVIIPCHIKHFPMLEELLNKYAKNQTVLPDEVIVSLSAVDGLSKAGRGRLRCLQQTEWPFVLKILISPETLPAGASRNRACKASMGDILICQDADDLPHPQRLEVIKWFFENYDIDHLMHAFIESFDEKFLNQEIDPEKIRWKALTEYCLFPNIANGPIAMSSQVFKKVQWTEENLHGEDVLFNQQVYKHFSKTVILYESLYLYRRGIQCLRY